jgi:hypothetical protein
LFHSGKFDQTYLDFQLLQFKGFDNNGESVYWNVVGDRVTAMCCLKAAQNVSSAQSSHMQTKLQISIKSTFSGGKSLGAANVKSAANEFSAMANTRVVVACEDKSIAVFEDEDLLWEMSESSPVTQLIAIDQNTFAFLTEGGMVGVYVKDQLKWRQPCPRPPTCLAL